MRAAATADSRDAGVRENANRRRVTARAGIVTGESPARSVQRAEGAVVTTKRSGVVTTATRQQLRGPVVGFRSDSRGFRAQSAPTNDLDAATAFTVAGRSNLAQANRTAKQTLNHCNSDTKNRATSRGRQGHRFIVESSDLRSIRSSRALAHLSYRVRGIALAITRSFINPAAPPRHAKEAI